MLSTSELINVVTHSIVSQHFHFSNAIASPADYLGVEGGGRFTVFYIPKHPSESAGAAARRTQRSNSEKRAPWVQVLKSLVLINYVWTLWVWRAQNQYKDLFLEIYLVLQCQQTALRFVSTLLRNVSRSKIRRISGKKCRSFEWG